MRSSIEMKECLLEGKYDAKLLELYLEEHHIDACRSRYADMIDRFAEIYGSREISIYSAPGRTEIGGNHTDHQNGKVLAASVNLDAVAIASPNSTGKIRIKSENYNPFTIDVSDLSVKKEEEGSSLALVRGVINGIQRRGYKIGGFDAYVSSNVLPGSGLSSSAAYEVLVANIISGEYNEGRIDAITIAQISQESERDYFGKPCGLMDQMACSVGGMIYIDFKDEENPVVEKVETDFNEFGYRICIVDTKGSHANLTDEYAAIPVEMRKVANYFGQMHLSQVEEAQFIENLADIRNRLGDRAVLRALHYFHENRRVEGEVEALAAKNFAEFMKIVKESGDSSYKYLQNVFSVKNVSRQEVSVALAFSEIFLNGRGVCRVHGGGFAGTIQAFVHKEYVKEYKEFIEGIYGRGACYMLHIRPVGGIKVL